MTTSQSYGAYLASLASEADCQYIIGDDLIRDVASLGLRRADAAALSKAQWEARELVEHERLDFAPIDDGMAQLGRLSWDAKASPLMQALAKRELLVRTGKVGTKCA